jgi:hypothetical protein
VVFERAEFALLPGLQAALVKYLPTLEGLFDVLLVRSGRLALCSRVPMLASQCLLALYVELAQFGLAGRQLVRYHAGWH